MEIGLVVASAIASGLGRRMVGGVLSHWIGFDLGDAPVRILWGVILGLVAFASGLWWPYAIAVVPLVWAGASIGYWHSMLPNSFRDWVMLTVHGVGGTVLLAGGAYALGLSWWYPLIAGLMCAPCYAFAKAFPWEIHWLECFKHDPPPTAELIWGACVGAGVALAFV